MPVLSPSLPSSVPISILHCGKTPTPKGFAILNDIVAELTRKYRAEKKSLQIIFKQDPGRARQSS